MGKHSRDAGDPDDEAYRFYFRYMSMVTPVALTMLTFQMTLERPLWVDFVVDVLLAAVAIIGLWARRQVDFRDLRERQDQYPDYNGGLPSVVLFAGAYGRVSWPGGLLFLIVSAFQVQLEVATEIAMQLRFPQ